MISFGEFTSIGNRLLLMALIAVITFGLFEFVKTILGDKIPTWFKKGFTYILIPVTGVIYMFIALGNKDVSPIATGLLNGVLFSAMEATAYILIDAIIDLVKFIVKKLDPKKKSITHD